MEMRWPNTWTIVFIVCGCDRWKNYSETNSTLRMFVVDATIQFHSHFACISNRNSYPRIVYIIIILMLFCTPLHCINVCTVCGWCIFMFLPANKFFHSQVQRASAGKCLTYTPIHISNVLLLLIWSCADNLDYKVYWSFYLSKEKYPINKWCFGWFFGNFVNYWNFEPDLCHHIFLDLCVVYKTDDVEYMLELREEE